MSRVTLRAVRRLGALAALTLAATVGVVAMDTATALAAPPGCGMAHGYDVDGSQNIHAYHLWVCDDGNDIYLNVNIKRYVSPGVWTVVASGSGFVSYYCNGNALNIYQVDGLPQFFDTCG